MEPVSSLAVIVTTHVAGLIMFAMQSSNKQEAEQAASDRINSHKRDKL